MTFDPPLRQAALVRRYKRFLADVVLDSGEALTVHCPNTGAMYGCADPGSRIWLSDHSNPKRKYRYSWELVQTREGVLVGINTGRSNALVREAIEKGVIPQLAGYGSIRAEVRYGHEASRADFLLSARHGGAGGDARNCTVEVKNVTALAAPGIAVFPDAVSVRATRHLRELALVAKEGGRAVLCYCVQREDVHEVRPARDIDPAYAAAAADAVQAGVELMAYAARMGAGEILLCRQVAVGGL